MSFWNLVGRSDNSTGGPHRGGPGGSLGGLRPWPLATHKVSLTLWPFLMNGGPQQRPWNGGKGGQGGVIMVDELRPGRAARITRPTTMIT